MSQTPAPLTTDELESLMWVATVANRVAIPHAHIERLLAEGYIHEDITGPVLTDLGERMLAREARTRCTAKAPCHCRQRYEPSGVPCRRRNVSARRNGHRLRSSS